MDHIIYRKQNYRNIRLDSNTVGQTVGVLRKDRTIKYLRWAGYIRREVAKNTYGAQPVLLAISRCEGDDLAEGEYVQGCLIGMEVFAVIDSKVAVVNKPSTTNGG